MNTLSIIIPSLFGKTALKTFDSVYKAIGDKTIEVIVVSDNKSADLAILKPYHFKGVFNLKKGVASARNYGASLTKSSHLLFIDDDMLITTQSLQIVFNFIESHPKDCLNIEWNYPFVLYEKMNKNSFGRFLIHHGFVHQRGWAKEWNWQDNSQFEIPLVASYFLVVPRDKFDQVSGYNESFPFAGFEDYDFPTRLKQKGVKMFIDTTSLIYHNEEEKTELSVWMRRKVTGGFTQKIGVELGYAEKAISYSLFKKTVYHLSCLFYLFLINLGKIMPEKAIFDRFSFRYYNFLLGLSIYKGYNKLF